jgi:hypothetical protein
MNCTHAGVLSVIVIQYWVFIRAFVCYPVITVHPLVRTINDLSHVN